MKLTGLTSATEYDFYVQTDCGGGDLSAWSGPATFVTPCDFYTVPFSENFDGVGWGEMPACWSSILLCADGFAWNGNQGGYFQMENSWDLNSTLMLISPPVLDLAPNRLKFNAQSSTAGAELLIGTMSNPADQNTFELLTSVTFTSAWVYEPFDVWLNGYTGTNNYFVIKHSNSSEYLTIQIDDIEVEALPTCLEPINLFVSDITTTSANFNWTEGGAATDWEIEIGELGFVPGTGTTYYYNNETIGQQVYPFTGLSSATTYDIYLRANCGAGDYSVWVGPVSFLTSFDAFASLPVTEDFETGFTNTINNIDNTVDWTIDNTLFVSGTASAANYYAGDDNNTLFVAGTMDFTGKSLVGLTFWHIAKTDGNYDHCYVEISTDGGASFDQLPISSYMGDGFYREAGLSNNPEGPCFDEDSYSDWGTGYETPDNTWWKQEAFDLSSYNLYSNVVIRFRLVSDTWTAKYGWFIDDIEIKVHDDPAISLNPMLINENATSVMPANLDLNVENTGGFVLNYTASVVYDEVDLINENFDSGLPGDWTVINNGNNSETWKNTTDFTGYSFNGTQFMICDGNQNWGPGTNSMDDELITPVIDASAYIGGGLQLEFDQAFDAHWSVGDTAKVFVFDGTEWIKIYESWTDDGLINWSNNGIRKVYDVSAYANANFQVKFHYIDDPVNQAMYFAIDNFRLRATTGAFGWLSLNGMESTNGAVFSVNGPTSINTMMDATGLAEGTYTAEILVTSTDAGNPSTTIPVTMNVIAGYTVSGDVTYATGNFSNVALENCSVELRDATDAVLFSTMTDATGYYEFTGLLDGDYTLVTTSATAYTYVTNLADVNVVG